MIRRFVSRNLLDKWDWGVGIADFYSTIDRFVIRPKWLRSFFHGTWLGHPLHPLLTDVPIGGLTIAQAKEAIGRQFATRITGFDDLFAERAQMMSQQLELGGLARPLPTLEGHK